MMIECVSMRTRKVRLLSVTLESPSPYTRPNHTQYNQVSRTSYCNVEGLNESGTRVAWGAPTAGIPMLATTHIHHATEPPVCQVLEILPDSPQDFS